MRSLRNKFTARLTDDHGQATILMALLMGFVMIGFLGLAIDIGMFYRERRIVQQAADAGAMAAAQAESMEGTGPVDAAKTAIQANGVTLNSTINSAPTTVVGKAIVNLVTMTPAANRGYVQVSVSENSPTYFLSIFGYNGVNVTASAQASYKISSATGACLLALDGAATPALTLNSGASIMNGVGATCAVTIDSGAGGGNTCNGASQAVMANASSTVNVNLFNIVGGICDHSSGGMTPTPKTGATGESDPFAGLTAPTKPAQSTTDVGTISGTMTLQPGSYGNLNFNGSGYTVTLSPGVYYFDGSVNIGAETLTGTNVTIYMDSGALTMNSAAQVNLTAPSTSQAAADGCTSCAGMAIWQNSTDTSAMILDSASNSSWKGAVYVPKGQLTLNGGSTGAAYGMVVADTVMMNSTLSLSCTYMPNGVCPGNGIEGAPIPGGVFLAQ